MEVMNFLLSKKTLDISLFRHNFFIISSLFSMDPVAYGPILAVAGAALAAVLGGIGSTLGVGYVGQASAGVAAEKPESSGGLIILSALPSSQGVYGLIVAVLVAFFFTIGELSTSQGWQVFLACLPAGITGLFSGIFQGKVAAAATNIVAKTGKVGSGLILTAMVETFAIFGLLVSILYIVNLSGSFGA